MAQREQVLIRLIAASRAGDCASSEQLFQSVYDELRVLARSLMRQERPGATLQPTAVVHEAILKATAQGPLTVEDRRHLFGVLANAMRQVLIDAARRRASAKRGGGWRRTSTSWTEEPGLARPEELAEIGDLLDVLAGTHARASEVVRLKVFAGVPMEEIAEMTGTPKRTVERDWQFARLWLMRELERRRGESGPDSG